jgi:hypothetical protein
VEDKFKRIIKMIKESELEESKCNEILKLIKDAIQEFKNEKFQLQFLILCQLDLGLSPLCDAYEDLEEHGIISVYRD